MAGEEAESDGERFAQYMDELTGVARYLLGIRAQDEESKQQP